MKSGITRSLGMELDGRAQLSSGSNKNWVIPVTGQASGVPTAGTLVFSATEDLSIYTTGDVTVTVVITTQTYRNHTITVNCPNGGSGDIVITDKLKVLSCGNHSGSPDPTINFYTGNDLTSPKLSWLLNDIPASVQKINQQDSYVNILSATGTKSLPSGLTYLYWSGSNLSWTYAGPLPSGLTFLRLSGAAKFAWTHDGAMPAGLRFVYIASSVCDWNGLDISGASNMTTLSLSDYRKSKMSSADMVVLLTSLTNRAGALPATVTINDYADYLSPPIAVSNAVTTLKSAKAIITLNLGA